MKRTLVMVGLALALGTSFTASAEPTARLRERIGVMLRAPEYTPTEAEWKALGPDAVAVLREIALDEKVLVLRRGRAAIALGYFKTDSSREALTRLVADEDAPWLLRGKAGHAMASAYGKDSLPLLEPLLAAKHRRLREAAVKTIATVPAPASREMLAQRLAKEKDPQVHALIQRTVEGIDKKGAKR